MSCATQLVAEQKTRMVDPEGLLVASRSFSEGSRCFNEPKCMVPITAACVFGFESDPHRAAFCVSERCGLTAVLPDDIWLEAGRKEPKAPAKEIRPAKSAGAFYRAEHRDRVIGANPDADIGEVIQILVDEYNELSEEEQAPYVEKEAADQV